MKGWTVASPAWGALVPIAMWAPALGRLVAVRTVDRRFASTLTLRRGGVTGAQVGWRGHLQPRLDAAGVRASVVVVMLCQLACHAALMAFGGYAGAASLGTSLALFAIGDLPVTFIWARESYRAHSLWPAVFLHSPHNTISQWLCPKFFTVAEDQIWRRGEGGLLPTAGYVVAGLAVFLWMRWRGPSWRTPCDRR